MDVNFFEPAKPAPSEMRGTASPNTSGPTESVQMTGFRHYQQPSLAFSASLVEGKVVTQGSYVGQDIAAQLNQLSRPFKQDATYAGPARNLRIRDDKFNVFHIQSTPAAAAVLKSSLPLSFYPSPPINPGRAHLGQISGVQTTAEGGQFRVVEQRLYRLEAQTLRWLPDKDEARYSRIGLSAQGQLMKVPQGVADMSIDGKTQASLEGFTLKISRDTADAALCLVPVNESGKPVQLAHLGLAGDVLYASTPQGEFLCANLRNAEDGQLVMRPEPLDNLEQLHQGAVSIKGFMHDDQGRLNALVLDSRRQLHSTPLSHGPDQASGWNLSDVILRVNDTGLPEPGLQTLAGRVDLGPRGKVALEGNTLLCWNERSQQWDKSAHHNVERLERGLDGRAYVLQGAELKALAIHKTRDAAYSGASYDLTPVNDAHAHINLGGAMVENNERKITGFAIDNARQFVTLDAENKLIAHVNGKARVLTFTRPKELVALALDRQGDLYAQTGAGELLKLDKAHWQTPCTSALTWTPVPVPDNAPVKSLRMGAGQQLIVSWGENNAQQKRWGEHYRQLIVSADGDPQWKPLTAHSNTPARSLGTVLGNAELKSQDNGTSWAVTSDCFGHKTEALSVDRGVIKSALAHFHPVQGIKNIGLGIQHDVKGRRGLADLYADVRELQGLLRTLASVTPRTMDISSRLDRLGEGQPTQALATKLKRFLSEVEECSVQLARRLGEIKGARVIPDYLPTTSGKPTEGSASNLSRIRQSFENMGSSKSDITAALLRSYEKQGVCLSLHDAGLKRDLSNSTGLIESDLIQHARTLFRLVKLVDRLEGKAPDQAEITARLESAIENYQNSPVHKKTSQSINGLKQAETLYNNFKLLARDLGTPGSALNFHITTTLGLNPQETVKQALLQCIQKSESGQSVASSRSKTLSASLFLLPVPLLEIIGGVSRDNTNGITLTRTDQGVSVDINMGTGHTVTGSVGVGNMLLPSEVPLEGRLRVGAETTLALTHENEQSVSFDIREADFPAMMAILTGEKGNVFDLLDLGSNHKSGTSSKNALDLSVSAHVQPRFHMLMPETSNTPGGLVRTMVNAGGGLQLFHVDQRSAVVLGQDEITRAQSVNTQWLARGSASLGMAPANGALWTQLGADGPTWVPYITSDSSFTLGFDRSVARSMRFTFKQPAVIDQAQVNGLRDALSRHSAPLKQHLASFAAQGPLVEQLQHLHRLFIQLPSPATRSEEHHALNEQLQTCLHQEALAAQGRRALKSVERTVSYVGVKGGPDHEWLNDAAPANKAAILRLFAQQPQFERIINDLESSQGTSVVIRLEVKPKVLRMIDNQIGDGPNAINDVQKALENPDNLRIKTLAVSYTATRTDAMKTPIPLVAYSSRAALSNSCKLLNIELKYGMDQNTPLRVEFKDTLPSARIRELNPEQLDQKIRHGRSPLM